MEPDIASGIVERLFGFAGGSALLYEYAGNDSVHGADPTGLAWVCNADCKRRLEFNRDFRESLAENLKGIPLLGGALARTTNSVLSAFMPSSAADLAANFEDDLRSLGSSIAMVSTPSRFVSGESMRRAKATAKQIGADYWRAWKIDPWDEALAKARDARWFRRKAQEGNEVVDASMEPTRTMRNEFHQPEPDLAELGVDMMPVDVLIKP